jgi:hypothetical protein
MRLSILFLNIFIFGHLKRGFFIFFGGFGGNLARSLYAISPSGGMVQSRWKAHAIRVYLKQTVQRRRKPFAMRYKKIKMFEKTLDNSKQT